MILVPTRVCDHGRCAYCTVEKRDAYPFFLHSPDLGTLIDRLSALESIQPSGTLRFF
jgi:hypothetical protein